MNCKTEQNKIIIAKVTTNFPAKFSNLCAVLSCFHLAWQIILWGREVQFLEETVSAVHRLDVNCSYMLCDVADKEQIYSCVSLPF